MSRHWQERARVVRHHMADTARLLLGFILAAAVALGVGLLLPACATMTPTQKAQLERATEATCNTFNPAAATIAGGVCDLLQEPARGIAQACSAPRSAP